MTTQNRRREESNLVRTFSWRFRQWSGAPIKDTYGGKPMLDSEGTPKFAELAVIPVIKKQGFSGAAWVDSYRRCFRDAMPPATCHLPEDVKAVYDRIALLNGNPWSGCWDVIAWNSEGGVSFVECKRKGKDRMQPSQWKWRASALKAGLQPANFLLCQWEFE